MKRCISSSGHVLIRDHLHRQGSWDRLDEEEGREWYPLVHGYKPSEVPLLHPGKQTRIVIRGSSHEPVTNWSRNKDHKLMYSLVTLH